MSFGPFAPLKKQRVEWRGVNEACPPTGLVNLTAVVSGFTLCGCDPYGLVPAFRLTDITQINRAFTLVPLYGTSQPSWGLFEGEDLSTEDCTTGATIGANLSFNLDCPGRFYIQLGTDLTDVFNEVNGSAAVNGGTYHFSDSNLLCNGIVTISW